MISNPIADTNLLLEGGFAILFPIGIFLTVLGIIYFISGWKELSQNYPFLSGSKPTKIYAWKSAKISLVNFNNCINFGITPFGLYIKPIKIFTFGFMKPILIPWNQITWKKRTSLGFSIMEITPQQTPNKKITISQKVYDLMKDDIETYNKSQKTTPDVF